MATILASKRDGTRLWRVPGDDGLGVPERAARVDVPDGCQCDYVLYIGNTYLAPIVGVQYRGGIDRLRADLLGAEGESLRPAPLDAYPVAVARSPEDPRPAYPLRREIHAAAVVRVHPVSERARAQSPGGAQRWTLHVRSEPID